jgi:glycosyltransferase involved in cell wall biosynthesis
MIEFSVIIPLYNKETTILKTLDSVLAQTYPHFEVVVVDDGSTDRSAELVTSLADSRIRYFKKENGGPSSARNLGVEKAEKEWLLFLDADDLLLGNALETFEKVIARTEGAGIFAANFYWVKKQAKWLYAKDYPEGVVRNPYKDWFLHRLMPRAGRVSSKKALRRTILTRNISAARRIPTSCST